VDVTACCFCVEYMFAMVAMVWWQNQGREEASRCTMVFLCLDDPSCSTFLPVLLLLLILLLLLCSLGCVPQVLLFKYPSVTLITVHTLSGCFFYATFSLFIFITDI
jgi:hypothetical protein